MPNNSPAAGLPPTATLTSQFQQQKASFLREGPPSLQARRDTLRRLKRLVTGHETDIVAALSTDFGHRSRHETLLAEMFTTVAGIKHASPISQPG
jgi:coniferyl-aldehyde dehydrogenase